MAGSLTRSTPSIACPVLQYADDTLIILQAEHDQLQTLKSILLKFSAATGLHINFHKSTFAPIHVDPELTSQLATILYPRSHRSLNPTSAYLYRLTNKT